MSATYFAFPLTAFTNLSSSPYCYCHHYYCYFYWCVPLPIQVPLVVWYAPSPSLATWVWWLGCGGLGVVAWVWWLAVDGD